MVTERLQSDLQFETGQVQLAPMSEHDAQAKSAAARFIGACLTHKEAEISFVQSAEAERTSPIESLYDALQLAAEGDARAYNMVRINVATDVIERTTKSGHVMEVSLDIDEAGRIQQFGQSMESVHANSLRYADKNNPQMLARTKAETVNAFRIAEYLKQGKLEDYDLVVFSRAADDMPEDDMRQAGFFVDTMSMAIQVTSAKDNVITTESAFVAGKQEPGAIRHDAEAVLRVGDMMGVDLRGMTATELLENPLLVPKSVLSNGVIDIVKMYDMASNHTFFGEANPRKDYLAYREHCRAREKRFDPMVDTITQKLISEAASITGRVDATKRLHQLSQDLMVQQAVFDTSIDPKVFGPAATQIVAARFNYLHNDMDKMLENLQGAQRVAVSSSCPDGKNGSTTAEGTEDSTQSEAVRDCEFISKQCPKCKKKDVKTVVSKGVISGSCGCKAKLS